MQVQSAHAPRSTCREGCGTQHRVWFLSLPSGQVGQTGGFVRCVPGADPQRPPSSTAPPRPWLVPGRGGWQVLCTQGHCGVGVRWGCGATGPRNRAGAVCERGTRPGLRTRLLAAAAMPWSGSRGSGRGPWRQCAAPRWLPCALCPVPAPHPPSPSTRGRCSPGSCSPVLVPELTGTCPQFPLRNVPFPLLEGGGTPDPHLGSASKDTAAVSTPGLPRAQHPHGCMCLGLWDLGWGMGVMSPPTSCLGGGTPVSDLIQPCTSCPRGM